MWAVEYTVEFGDWWKELSEGQQDDTTAVVELLEEYIPIADRLYDEHIEQICKEGLIK